MKFRSKKAELAVLTLACGLAYVGIGAAFRVFSGHWPSLGFWLGGVVVYVLVTLPAIKRGWGKAN